LPSKPPRPLPEGLPLAGVRRQGMFLKGFPKSGGPLTQEVEYLPFKQRVVGSSPARPTIHGRFCKRPRQKEWRVGKCESIQVL
jgi:hypothetical protein